MTEFLRCLLMVTGEITLLLPYSAIAEVIPYQNLTRIKNVPSWIVGMTHWRGLEIPLLDFANIDNINKEINIDELNHIAVLNKLIQTSDLKFAGLILNETPHMLRFKRADIKWIGDPQKPHLLAEVTVRGQKAFIPNMIWIQKKMIEAMATTAGPVGQST